MRKMKEALLLSEEGYQGVLKAIVACLITNFSMMIPYSIIVMIIIEVIQPFLGGEMSWNKIWIYLGLGLIGAVIVFFANRNDYRKTYINTYIESEKTRIAIAERIRKLPMSVFNSKDLTELTTAIMGDVATTEHVFSHIIPQLVANGISISVICIFLSFLDWRMSLAVFISVPVAFAVVFLSKKLQSKMGNKHAKSKLDASDKTQEYLEGIKVIKACNMDGANFEALENALRLMKKLAIQFEFGTGVFVTSSQVILQSGIGLTVSLGVYLLSNQSIALIPMLMFFLIVTRIYGPVLVELTLLPELFYHQIALKRLRQLMSFELMEGEEVSLDHYDISFEDVSFSYNNDSQEALQHINLNLPQGSLTALVGPSGSGKSTVSRLVARFWDVNQGVVKVGGINVKTIDPEHLMSYMSFVFQDVVLFNDTVYNNIRIGNMEATEEQIYEAARFAHCDEFIRELPEGYQTVLGENGNTISGGERQRISIARALLKDAPIVLLDEVTASIDPENEHLIQEAISVLIQNKTVLVIAHRLRTITSADQIVVLNHGQVEEAGTHETLMAREGLYYQLYTVQQASAGWQV